MAEASNKNRTTRAKKVQEAPPKVENPTPEVDLKALEEQIRKDVHEEYNQQLAKLQKDIHDEYNQQLAELHAELAKAKKAEPTTEVFGSVEIELEDARGKKIKKKVGISDGHPKIRPLVGQSFIMKSEHFLKFANGDYSEEEAKPIIDAGLTIEIAKDHLRMMVESGSSMVKVL